VTEFDPKDPEWENILERAKHKIKSCCRYLIRTKTNTGGFLERRCEKNAKYVIKQKYWSEYPACPKHAQELREKANTTVRPLDPKLDIFM